MQHPLQNRVRQERPRPAGDDTFLSRELEIRFARELTSLASGTTSRPLVWYCFHPIYFARTREVNDPLNLQRLQFENDPTLSPESRSPARRPPTSAKCDGPTCLTSLNAIGQPPCLRPTTPETSILDVCTGRNSLTSRQARPDPDCRAEDRESSSEFWRARTAIRV